MNKSNSSNNTTNIIKIVFYLALLFVIIMLLNLNSCDSETKSYSKIINNPTKLLCSEFLEKNQKSKNASHVAEILDSIVRSEYIENDSDIVHLYVFLCEMSNIKGTDFVDNLKKRAGVRFVSLWNKTPELEEYSIPDSIEIKNYKILENYFWDVEDLAMRYAILTYRYDEFRHRYPNSKYDKIMARKIIEFAIKMGNYEEMTPMKKIKSSISGLALIHIENRTSYLLNIYYLNNEDNKNDVQIIIEPQFSKCIELVPGNYTIYASVNEKTSEKTRNFVSKYTSITSGEYNNAFVIEIGRNR